MKENFHENDYGMAWIEDSIVFAIFKPIESLELPMAKACVEMRLKASNGISYPMLIDIKKVRFVPKPSRDYMASAEACQYANAAALLINSNVGRVIGNFFLQFSKPLVPVEIFTNKQKAIKWLQQYVNKEQKEKGLLQTALIG